MKSYSTQDPNTYRQVNAVIQTACPACDAAPGFACFAESPLLENIFHGARLMATEFPRDGAE